MRRKKNKPTKLFMGIDPGGSGAITIVNQYGKHVAHIKNKETLEDLCEFVDRYSVATFCFLERVSAMPRQGVSSTFKFGTSYGQLQGMISYAGIPWELVTPVQWQTLLKCRTGGDKKISKAAAQRLFPDTKITHANADALLLAEYCRRICLERGLI